MASRIASLALVIVLVSIANNCGPAMANLAPNLPASSAKQVTIEIDFSKPIGRIRSLQQVHAGPIPKTKGAAQLHDQYRQIGVDYIRTHDGRPFFDIDVVFPNMQADPSNESSYTFSSTDLQVEAIRSTGAEVFYRLGYTWGGPYSKTPPSDYAKFAEICKHIVMHYNHGWAKGFRYGIQYWEVWNEPDIGEFWTGTPAQYFTLYDVVAKALKALGQDLKVGGPSLSGGPAFWNRGFLEDFLRFYKTNESRAQPLNFSVT